MHSKFLGTSKAGFFNPFRKLRMCLVVFVAEICRIWYLIYPD
jgi:hypothetical protein